MIQTNINLHEVHFTLLDLCLMCVVRVCFVVLLVINIVGLCLVFVLCFIGVGKYVL